MYQALNNDRQQGRTWKLNSTEKSLSTEHQISIVTSSFKFQVPSAKSPWSLSLFSLLSHRPHPHESTELDTKIFNWAYVFNGEVGFNWSQLSSITRMAVIFRCSTSRIGICLRPRHVLLKVDHEQHAYSLAVTHSLADWSVVQLSMFLHFC